MMAFCFSFWMGQQAGARCEQSRACRHAAKKRSPVKSARARREIGKLRWRLSFHLIHCVSFDLVLTFLLATVAESVSRMTH
jgi:hypothetical protein